ncbi:SDR family oxidoreductase [Vibrio ulleungensis]|uniref:SDR family oxidoreductase n=1 Tax=Vibrio ulleungensis TaxID=2807619 RepID=A0ABS2HFM7_9VIBR|nr:SDR family oxidoreductase [Vibrio ulleungensis]MBM7035197.1 SDR family oxidoreductase [Vibrio ulleungensis]
MKKVAIVTGASTGLGASVAIKLAQQGYVTYATMRNLAKSPALEEMANKANVTLNITQLDVESSESVNNAIASIIADEGQVDLLVNNAGAGFVKTTEHASEEEIEWVTNVNYHGVVRCTKAVLGAMRERQSGHVINVTSVGGLVGQPFNELYCAAKFAVEGYTESLASYVTPSFGIKFTAVEPGGIASEFANSVLKQLTSTGGMPEDQYKPILENYIAGAQSRAAQQGDVYQTADQVADVIIDCANMDSPPVRTRTSAWGEEFTSLKTQADPDGSKLQAKISSQLI